MFEQAARLKLRFNHKGMCSVEDLWDISLTSLDEIFKGLNKQIKLTNEESLLTTKSKMTKILILRMNIVKYIVKVRLKEQIEKESDLKRSEKKQEILGVIKDKQSEGLKNMPLDDLINLYENI